MILRFKLLAAISFATTLGETIAHGNHHHGHHHHDHAGHNDDDGSSRNLRGPPNGVIPPGQCKDGEPTFTVGSKTYACQSEFQAAGGRCHTEDHTPEERAEVKAQFQSWRENKKGQGNKGGPNNKEDLMEGHPLFDRDRKLQGGCGGNCVDWAANQVITIPVNFHIFHNGNTGKQFTCKYVQGSGFQELTGGNCEYIKEQIRVLNRGFGGEVQDNRPSTYNDDTQIQFCLQGANDVRPIAEYDNNQHYSDTGGGQNSGYKATFRRGGMETLNVWAGDGGGYLGYAYFPSSNVRNLDGIVIASNSMPNGGRPPYSLGDTLTHELGHWLELEHTFNGGCNSNTGDYMDLANDAMSFESSANYGCPLGRNTCSGDGGNDPIHNFMDYTDDNCMDEFNPGQSIQMQFAWETYRHFVGESDLWTLAADGVSCTQESQPTSSPVTPSPTTSPTMKPTSSPVTPSPTSSPVTQSPTTSPTMKPTGSPVQTVVKYICSNKSQSDNNICLNGSVSAASGGKCPIGTDNSGCGNGNKICQLANCPGTSGPSPPSPPSPTPPPPTPPTGNCSSSGQSCRDGGDCCSGTCNKFRGTRTCA